MANQADIAEEDLKQLVDWFCATEKVLTLFSQGVNQSSSGTDKVNSIINCHLASGRLGRPGMGPFSLTGQPNAMGGREVGGLANMLAAHMDPTNPDDRDTVRRFWNAPNLIDGPGHKAIDLFNAIEAGQIKAVWIMATNPAVSLPDVTRMRQALIQCELVIVSDCMAQTDSLDLAHIALPATGWSEKDGTVTNSERRISRQPALVAPMGDARHDWQAMCDVAKRLGFGAAFDYASPADIFREHARLSGFENHGTRIFDISGLADLSDSQYQDLRPIQWPVNSKHPNGCDRLFGDGQFATPDGRARLLPIKSQACLQQPNADYPLIVNSGRIRDQWHTMTRTGRSARLLQHRPEPFIEINPADVVRYGLQDGHLARLTGRGGQYAGRVRATQSQRIGEVFVPMHWTRQFASQGCSGNLYQAITDPISGQPESKHGIAHIAPIHARWEARLIARNEIPKAPTDWWAQVKLEHSVSRHLAGETPIQDWPAWCQQHLSIPSLSIENKANQQFRAASIVDGQLQWVLIVQPSTVLPDLEWLDQQFDGPIDLATRARLLTATGADDQNSGGVICSCFQVRQGAIEQAIAAGQDDIDTLGRQLKCGTNCGSCIPELNALISASTTESAPMA